MVELARQIERIAGFTDLKRGITVNPGVISGGTRSNVIAAEAEARYRYSHSPVRDAAALERKFRALRPFDKRCSLELTGGLTARRWSAARVPWNFSSLARTLARRIGRGARRILHGRRVGREFHRGARDSDAGRNRRGGRRRARGAREHSDRADCRPRGPSREAHRRDILGSMKPGSMKAGPMKPSHLLSLACGAMLVLGMTTVSQSNAQAPDHVYELRTYHTMPGKLEDLKTRFRDHTITIFDRHNMKSVGYWIPETESNQCSDLHPRVSEPRSSHEELGRFPCRSGVAEGGEGIGGRRQTGGSCRRRLHEPRGFLANEVICAQL